MGRTFIVGDVHACPDELADLAAHINFDVAADRLILAGDLVAKGPDSAGVVAWARAHGAEAVLGNHDARVLEVVDELAGIRPKGKRAPKKHHVEAARQLTADDVAWLRACPLWLSLEVAGASFLVVHAGLVPGVALEAQKRRFLLNLRSILADGTPTPGFEGDPWAAHWQGPPFVVFGHDALRGLQQHPWATGLDTGCVYGGSLTALELTSKEIFAVPARKPYLSL